MHLPTREEILALPGFTPEDPLRVLTSACLTGALCGYDGTSYGDQPPIEKLAGLPNVQLIPFCPEDVAFGTPRELCNIHGGNGFDVLDGKARVLTESGTDWTGGMIAAAHQMLELADRHRVHVAILMDISAACGSQVIYDGVRGHKNYQKGPGVCAALLIRHGYKVVSQRDYRTLQWIFRKLDPNHIVDERAADHHETAWYRDYFGE